MFRYLKYGLICREGRPLRGARRVLVKVLIIRPLIPSTQGWSLPRAYYDTNVFVERSRRLTSRFSHLV